MKYICLIRVEHWQCNLRSLENINNEREMPQDDNRLVGNVQLCNFIYQESGHLHSCKDHRNELCNTLILIRYH